MFKLSKEVEHIYSKSVKDGLIEEDDTAVLFYSLDNLDEILSALKTSFGSNQSVAIKTNPTKAILKHIVKKGFALEAASIEEVRLALSSEVGSSNIIFDSPVKTRNEILEVAQNPNVLLNANFLEELDRIPTNAQCQVGLRINPLLETDAPEKFAVSTKKSKFGVPISNKEQIVDKLISTSFVTALHMHIGSGINDYSGHVLAVNKMVDLADEVNYEREKRGIKSRIATLDIGGGLKGLSTLDESCGHIRDYKKSLIDTIPDLFERFKIITEFGQLVHAHVGMALSKVEYVKHLESKQVAYIHLGADLFTRKVYAGLGSQLEYFVLGKNNDDLLPTDIVGPLCFAGDVLEEDVMLPKFMSDDIIAISGVGANTLGLWSRHCSRNVPKIIVYSLKKDEMLIAESRKQVW